MTSLVLLGSATVTRAVWPVRLQPGSPDLLALALWRGSVGRGEGGYDHRPSSWSPAVPWRTLITSLPRPCHLFCLVKGHWARLAGTPGSCGPQASFLQKAFSGMESGMLRMAATVELGTGLVGGEVALLPQTPQLSCRLGQWRLLRGESEQDCVRQ